MTGLRWGIMGTGGIASAMADTLRAVGSEPVVVGSARPGAADEFAARHEVAQTVDSHDAVAEFPGVDVVYVATTNDRHLDNALACVAAGVPVLCEKPLALNAAQATQMLEAATAAGVFAMEAMWMRFQPFMPKLEELLASGAIGELRHIQANLSFFLPMDPARRWVNPDLGGGSLLDLGVYPLTLVHHLAGPPEEFEAMAHVGATGVDLETMVISRHLGDVTASCTSSFVSDGTNEAVIGGSEGRLRLHARFHHPATMTLERRTDVVETIDTSYEGHGFRFEIAEVERCIRGGLVESPLRPHLATLDVLSWMDAIRTRCNITYPQDPW